MAKLFVYGTMKRGFPLHDQGLRDAECLGWHRTVQPYPMVIGGSIFGPMMFEQPGKGFQVWGELYEVDDERLARVDEAENMGLPGNFRTTILIEPMEGGEPTEAIAYTKAEALAEPRHSGYLADYQDRRFVPPWER